MLLPLALDQAVPSAACLLGNPTHTLTPRTQHPTTSSFPFAAPPPPHTHHQALTSPGGNSPSTVHLQTCTFTGIQPRSPPHSALPRSTCPGGRTYTSTHVLTHLAGVDGHVCIAAHVQAGQGGQALLHLHHDQLVHVGQHLRQRATKTRGSNTTHVPLAANGTMLDHVSAMQCKSQLVHVGQHLRQHQPPPNRRRRHQCQQAGLSPSSLQLPASPSC